MIQPWLPGLPSCLNVNPSSSPEWPLLLPLTLWLLSVLSVFVYLLPSTSNASSLLCPSSVKPALPWPLSFPPAELGASPLCLPPGVQHCPHRTLLTYLHVFFFHLLNGDGHVLFIFVFPAPHTVPGIWEVFSQYCPKNE